MKTITTLTAIAALIAGISIASAQNAGGPAGPSASPSNINKGSDASSPMGSQSGSESGSTAKQSGGTKDRVTGTGKFCIQASKSGSGIVCSFATLEACTKDAQPRGLQCSPNPNMGTTGAK
jgi:Protein of unknown function (DUF3551)